MSPWYWRFIGEAWRRVCIYAVDLWFYVVRVIFLVYVGFSCFCSYIELIHFQIMLSLHAGIKFSRVKLLCLDTQILNFKIPIYWVWYVNVQWWNRPIYLCQYQFHLLQLPTCYKILQFWRIGKATFCFVKSQTFVPWGNVCTWSVPTAATVPKVMTKFVCAQ